MMANQIGGKGSQLDILIRQGATFGPHRVTIKDENSNPINLTGAVFTGQIRKTITSTTVSAEIVTSIIDPINGIIEISIPWNVTKDLPAGETEKDEKSIYFWDYELKDSQDKIVPLFYGTARVFREITR